MDSQTANLITIIGGIVGIIALICFFTMVSNVAKIKKFQKVQMNILIEMALKNGIEPDKVESIKTELVGFFG
jgi:hypothetical protein